jgi:hypothetical protein
MLFSLHHFRSKRQKGQIMRKIRGVCLVFYGFDDAWNRLVEMQLIYMAIFVLESHVFGEMILYHLVNSC